MPSDDEFKNNMAEDQYELQVLKEIIQQLNQFSDRKEIAEISEAIIKISVGEVVDFGVFRERLLKIYHLERVHGHWYNEQFYDAIFSLLLLLAKYNPVNLDCPIGLDRINPESRLLTISGQHFDLENLITWIDRNQIHPLTRKNFSPRELSYFNARAQNQVLEIPDPRRPNSNSSWENFKTYFYKFGSYIRRNSMFIGCGALVGGPSGYLGSALSSVAPPSLFLLGIVLGCTIGGVAIGALIALGCKGIYDLIKHHHPSEKPILLARNQTRPYINLDQCSQLLYGIKQGPQLPALITEESDLEMKNEASLGSTLQVNTALNLNQTPVNNLTQPLLSKELLPVNHTFLQRVEEKAKNDRLLAVKSTPPQQVRSR